MMVGGCCVCSDERGWDENPLVYCDGQGCSVAVHQACYGIVTVPSGPWFCRKCEERAQRAKCELCPSRDGALKKTDTQGWAHVVCALYIPEVRFGNVTTMEPILISLVPNDRFSRSCYICEESERGTKASVGACMQCNKQGCKQSFHVTCAQMLGLLCEEAGNMMDNVKYCGYCQHHYSKLKKTSNMKIIPPFRPVPHSPISSGMSETNPVVILNKDLSPDINIKSMKKKMPSSSSSSTSSKSGANQNSNQSSAIPRIATSNVFSAGAFSSNLNKSSSEQGDNRNAGDSQMVPKGEDSFVLKSEDLKNSSSLSSQSINGGSDKSRKYLKGAGGGSSDFMTVKLNDIIQGQLDRPMSETNQATTPRDKSQPPDIKPHVTLTPIPMRSNDKLGKQTSDPGKAILFSPSSSSQSPSISTKLKESPGGLDSDKPMAEISPTSFTADKKRTRLVGGGSMDFVGPDPDQNNSDGRLGNASVWDLKQSQSNGNQNNTSGNGDEPHDGNSHPQQSQVPQKRGPGRPVKRRTGPGREEERPEESAGMRKKSKRGGRGGRSGSYTRRDIRDESGLTTPPPLQASNSAYVDDSSNDSKKQTNGQTNNSNNNNNNTAKKNQPASMKRQEEVCPTMSQLISQREQMQAANNKHISSQADHPNNNNTNNNINNSSNTTASSVLPTDLFGNAINPASSMAQRMVDSLSQDMETIAATSEKVDKPPEKLVGIPLPKASTTIHPSSTSITTNGTSNTNPPQTLEQLLERQWEQGSQFLMEQAQHLDIAQLLSCLNQLKQDNRALEEHVSSLIARKEQLIAINARLSIPLSSSITLAPGGDRSFHHTEGPSQQRTGTEIHPQLQNQQQPNQSTARHSGLPVSVVVNSHPSPHLNHGQNRESR